MPQPAKCDECEQWTETPVLVANDYGDRFVDETWCPACLAEQMADAFFGASDIAPDQDTR